MKFSIIIVAYKAPEALARCLESLAAHAPEKNEAEILIVDNSPESIQGGVSNDLLYRLLHAGYLSVEFFWDGRNLGFAAGCNEGARHANGKNLVFINPDTVVYEGWSERMAGYLAMPKVGAVGPISNFVAGLQHLIYHMNPGADFEKTAALAARGLNGRGIDTKLLIGFFLMMTRKVWDEVGGMDPVFFLGCDDLDLSLRLRDAGYTLVIASDVFVYHEGHQSFYAMGAESMTLNKQAEKALLKKLQAKYGETLPGSTELWGCEILPTDTSGPMTLSVCMIVRDEEENLKALLPQLAFADEIVILDTKPDREYPFNAEIIQDWAVSLFPVLARKVKADLMPWTDDFSTARNKALSLCTKDWILWVDADDRIPEHSANLIKAALTSPGPLTAQRKCHFALRLRDHLPNGRLGFTDQPRIFPNLSGMFWEGKIHEGYMDAADKLGLKLVTTGIPIDHHGYEDAEVLAGKHRRNLSILRSDIDSPLKFYQIAKSEMGLKQFEAARGALRTCLSYDWGRPLAPDLIAQIGYMTALSYYQEFGNAVEPMDEHLAGNPKPDALFLRAERAFFQGKIDDAEPMFREYAGFGEIMDYYGTDRDTFQVAAGMRLEQIEKLRTLIPG